MSEKKPIVIEMDFSEPKPYVPETLDDAEPYVACVISTGSVAWVDDSKKIVCVNDSGQCFHLQTHPSTWAVKRVLGPIKFNIKL